MVFLREVTGANQVHQVQVHELEVLRAVGETVES